MKAILLSLGGDKQGLVFTGSYRTPWQIPHMVCDMMGMDEPWVSLAALPKGQGVEQYRRDRGVTRASLAKIIKAESPNHNTKVLADYFLAIALSAFSDEDRFSKVIALACLSVARLLLLGVHWVRDWQKGPPFWSNANLEGRQHKSTTWALPYPLKRIEQAMQVIIMRCTELREGMLEDHHFSDWDIPSMVDESGTLKEPWITTQRSTPLELLEEELLKRSGPPLTQRVGETARVLIDALKEKVRKAAETSSMGLHQRQYDRKESPREVVLPGSVSRPADSDF